MVVLGSDVEYVMLSKNVCSYDWVGSVTKPAEKNAAWLELGWHWPKRLRRCEICDFPACKSLLASFCVVHALASLGMKLLCYSGSVFCSSLHGLRLGRFLSLQRLSNQVVGHSVVAVYGLLVHMHRLLDLVQLCFPGPPP